MQCTLIYFLATTELDQMTLADLPVSHTTAGNNVASHYYVIVY